MISFNLISLPDLCAAVVGAIITFLFLSRAIRAGVRNNAQFVFGLQMLFVTTICVLVFLSDNVVPADTDASSLAGTAPQATLRLFHYMFACGTLVLATMTHFSFLFAEHDRASGCRAPEEIASTERRRLPRGFNVLLTYGGALAIGGLIIFIPESASGKFLAMRTVPLQERPDFSCLVPFQPEYGPLASVYIIGWILVVFHAVYILASSRKRTGPKLPARLVHHGQVKKRIVTSGILCWGAAGIVSLVQGFHGWSGFDFSVLVVIAGMVLVSVGLL